MISVSQVIMIYFDFAISFSQIPFYFLMYLIIYTLKKKSNIDYWEYQPDYIYVCVCILYTHFSQVYRGIICIE